MSKNAGYIVETKSGKTGRTYHIKGLVNGKVPVYLEVSEFKYSEQATLCEPDSLTVKGFIE